MAVTAVIFDTVISAKVFLHTRSVFLGWKAHAQFSRLRISIGFDRQNTLKPNVQKINL
jgi:hypothetical protein